MKYSPSTIEVFIGFLGSPQMTLSFLDNKPSISLKVRFSVTSILG